MKEIYRILFTLLMLLIVLYLVTRIFKRADEKAILFPAKTYYSKGNAPDSVREQITYRLKEFQDAYSRRDTSDIEEFMESLYSKENILILGTMPNEIYSGYERAARLIKSDWESWGDCRFDTDSANISSSGNTAWFSARGYVEFDISRLLVIPLRLTGIMVKENNKWKFQQQQFQFDIDFSSILVVTLILSAWILICVFSILFRIYKMSKPIQFDQYDLSNGDTNPGAY